MVSITITDEYKALAADVKGTTTRPDALSFGPSSVATAAILNLLTRMCSTTRICHLIVHHHFMGSVSTTKMNKIVKLLEGNNISKESILRDPWIFRYAVDTVKKRLHLFNNLGINEIKPWEVRCSSQNLKRKLQNQLKAQRVLGLANTYIFYLSKKLNMNADDVTHHINRRPTILNISINKMNTIINLMLQNGYEGSEILFHYKVFSVKLNKVKERLQQLDKFPGKKKICAIHYSESQFQKYLEKLKQESNIKEDI